MMSAADKPLIGKRILVTRAPDRAQELVRELQQAGAEVLLLPTVGIEPPPDWRPLDEALRHLEEFNAVLFVSTNAVDCTFKRALILRKDKVMRDLPGRLVAAVGPATARAAAVRGIPVDYVASEHTGESLVRELGSSLRGRKVLLPHSDRGDKKLSESLREAGAEVTDVVAYRTAAPEPLDPELIRRIRSGEVHVLTFASPSAYDNLAKWIDSAELAELSSVVQFATIGSITAGVIRRKGGRVSIVASEPSARGFTEAIVKYYEREQSYREGAQREH
jgi:uroporphyrinogen III methyltransferase/synthase